MAKTKAATPDAVREINARIAASYDTYPYDPPAAPHLDPAYHRPLAAIFGLNDDPQDVLDLACGAGAQMALMSSMSSGRIVGLDISRVACDRTIARFAEAGRAADIRCTDILDVSAEELGQFDLVACIGSLYVVPQPVKAKMLELIGQCTRPGGIAILSYYCGLSGHVAAELQRIIKANIDLSAPIETALAAGRRTLEELIVLFKFMGASRDVILRAEDMATLPDVNLYHELFGADVKALSTLDLHESLEAHGMGVVCYLPVDPSIPNPLSRRRALALDAIDLMRGGYSYVVFAKWPTERHAADPTTPKVLWTSTYRPNPGVGVNAFRSEEANLNITVPEAASRAFIAEIADEPLIWADALQRARARHAATEPSAPFNEAAMVNDVLHLWQAGGLGPMIPGLARPTPGKP